jgi:hypothetical protein
LSRSASLRSGGRLAILSVYVAAVVFVAAGAACKSGATAPQDPRWSETRAQAWYAAQTRPLGANYVPATAINQLEMWQTATFDLARIDQELGWAEGLGFNTMRVFLHDLPWKEDETGFVRRIGAFLDVAARHRIKAMLVLFDSCWDPQPRLGPQRAPRRWTHNSGWVQSPGALALADVSEHARLERYVRGVVRAFAKDERVLAWDIWNEPDCNNQDSYKDIEPANKVDLVAALLPRAFAWARSEEPMQPLTSALWHGDWSSDAAIAASRIAQIQIQESDVVSFHNYDDAELEKRIGWLERYRRPILCSEYMARPRSTVHGALSIFARHRVGAYNWGFVTGKTQTIYPWSSWKDPKPGEPIPWFHDLLREDGTPYDDAEAKAIRSAR